MGFLFFFFYKRFQHTETVYLGFKYLFFIFKKKRVYNVLKIIACNFKSNMILFFIHRLKKTNVFAASLPLFRRVYEMMRNN